MELQKSQNAQPNIVDVAIRIVGSQVELAKQCGVSKQAVAKWRASNRVGVKSVKKLSEVTGLPPYVIRPDVFWSA
jgi:DNA-binding transcriptional regulator YdaS (Cro superfamily)